MRRLVIEADGGSRGNPGPAAYGAVVLDGVSGEVLVELADYLGVQTNNVAEYEGVTAGLVAAQEIDPQAQVEARLDSRLVVEQLSGGWAIRNTRLRELALRAKALAPPDRVRFTWVPRAQNARADALANESLDAAAAGRPARVERWQPGAGDTDPHVDAAERLRASARDEAAGVADVDEHRGGEAGEGGVVAAAAGAAQVRGAMRGQPSEPDVPGMLPMSSEAGRAAPAARIVGWSRAELGQPTTLLLVRHGVSQQSTEHRFSGTNGADPPLVDLGRRQAEAAADELARRGGADVIVTSPLRRTQETAAIITARLGLGEPIVVPGIAEADFGEWDSLTFAEVKERWPDALAAWLASVELAPPGGESFASVRRRVDSARVELLGRFSGKRVLAVTHVTPIKVLVQQVLEAPASSAYRFELAPCSLTTLAWWADGLSTVFGMGETGHLHGVQHETA